MTRRYVAIFEKYGWGGMTGTDIKVEIFFGGSKKETAVSFKAQNAEILPETLSLIKEAIDEGLMKAANITDPALKEKTLKIKWRAYTRGEFSRVIKLEEHDMKEFLIRFSQAVGICLMLVAWVVMEGTQTMAQGIRETTGIEFP